MEKQKARNLARRAAETMLASDAASRGLGMLLEEIGSGWARVSMSVRKDMVNGHDIAHGGMVFALADTAFACACNSYNIVNVAQSCQINFLRPALLGDVLMAEAREISRGRRSGLYDVDVKNQNGQLIASFRGQSAALDKTLVED
ncbi:MAG TPA: hydroxyphenylacetyl-CoA thioesterase PaaI [Hellea balneolensis]|uniref:Hydroxyphenylacetyl-CoA thioesterase PaaI n=1 Tax=Hellea balneolensis TaxID=287478 RepID=A0A7V5NWK9_9PROT|nr:hydroxyphenylacetyl-CoA thioesterase PaaI [Hellea balneolensis]